MLNSWFHKGLAMILDEVVVLDRALETDEILAYLTAGKAGHRLRGHPGRDSIS